MYYVFGVLIITSFIKNAGGMRNEISLSGCLVIFEKEIQGLTKIFRTYKFIFKIR